MKKVRLSLKRGKKLWSTVLFDSPESAYYLKDDPCLEDDVGTEEYCKTVKLHPRELMEVEWMGSEYVYRDEVETALGSLNLSTSTIAHDKFDKVRICKSIDLDLPDPTAAYVELYSGWVPSGVVPWHADATQKDIKITQIKGKVVSKFDFSKLFSSLEDDTSESQVEEKPQALN